ncbi:Chromate transport protein ChrA [hydrothermal vent metagenome]|uniref:Chromate transport protein ChrA n=1 Tax=hydrothermal vent metagenome TaxID=652676 RepID=A0A3B0XK12_9ZZZZ
MSAEPTEFLNQQQTSIWKLFWTFLKIGSTAFGGFMALISVVQNYLVDREKLLTEEDMLDGTSLAMLLPGPVAVNVVAYAGYRIRGIPGAIACASAVILPSFFLILFLSYAYFTWGGIPAINNIFLGFLPAVAAIIIAAAFNMGKKALKGYVEMAIALAALLALIFIEGFYITLVIIFLSGLIGWVFFREKSAESASPDKQTGTADKKLDIRTPITIISGSTLALVSLLFLNSQAFITGKLFATFAGMSLLLFGGGFVFIPLMQETIVETYHWVTQKEFIDAIAMGQITPGPILISATFIGYKVAGIAGAAVATIGIFTPPAVLMLICTHYLSILKTSKTIQTILKGVRCGVIGMIAAAAYKVGMTADPNLISLAIFLASLFALIKLKLEVAWIIPAAGLTTFLAYMM